METWARLFPILWLIGGVSGLRWLSRSESGPIQVCSGHSIQLLWNFTLDSGERVKHMVWRYQVEGGSEDTWVTCEDGRLVPKPSFSGGLAQHTDRGRTELSCATGTILESGNYNIAISVEHRNNSQTLHRKTAMVNVVDTPKTQSGEFHVTTKAEAVRDVTTGAWHVHLACGNFSDLGHPPVHVIWTTPSGEQLESSGYEDGAFLLALANPVLTGNYSCRIAPVLPAAHCLPSHSPLHNTEGVQVEAAAARLAVMEAQQREMMDTIAQMKDTMAADRREMNHTIAEMNDTIAEMNNTIAEMNTTMAADRREMDEIHRNSAPVSFHATLRNSIHLHGGFILKPTNVISNQGGGYNSTTGVFTAPVSGTYFFIGTTGPSSSGKWIDMSLEKEGLDVSKTLVRRYGDHPSMGSCHGVVDMEAGERVWLQSRWNSDFYSYVTSFSGFRID